MVNKLSFVLSMSSKCKVLLVSIFRVVKLMERRGVESVYCEANASESFPAFAPPTSTENKSSNNQVLLN
jgi:hypothetical protein